jgi:hypothetical protein
MLVMKKSSLTRLADFPEVGAVISSQFTGMGVFDRGRPSPSTYMIQILFGWEQILARIDA